MLTGDSLGQTTVNLDDRRSFVTEESSDSLLGNTNSTREQCCFVSLVLWREFKEFKEFFTELL